MFAAAQPTLEPFVVFCAVTLVGLGLFYLRFRPEPRDPTIIREALEQGALIVDVRSPEEFRGGHIDGAINIPVGEIGHKVADLKATGQTVIVYCASGMRSMQATALLGRRGVPTIDLGSMSRWPL